MKTIDDDGALTAAAFCSLAAIASLPIADLRRKVYDIVPEKMWQLHRWTRGQLVAKIFDAWLKRNGLRDESDSPE